MAARPPAGAINFADRRERLATTVRAIHPVPAAYLICEPRDIHYLTGVREGVSWLAVWRGGCFAVSRHMLIEEVREAAPDCEVLLPCQRSTERADLEHFVLAELHRRQIHGAMIEQSKISASSHIHLSAQAAAHRIELIAAPRVLEEMRQCKDDPERRLIEECIRIAETAFSGLIEGGAAGLVGRSEREIAIELEARMIGLGADRQGFPETGIIVASGPNSASAHHLPGHRRVLAGEPLLIDWGAEVSSYRSDLTRTLFPSRPPEFARRSYPVVEAALHAAVAGLRAGARMSEVDSASRGIVTDAGYTEFHYGVGHGIGLAIHEAPWIRADSPASFEAGMITTIEPGIYLPSTGGIRIENVYGITCDGCDRLGTLPFTLDDMVLE